MTAGLPGEERVFIGLGSNMEAETHLKQAMQMLRRMPEVREVAISPVYRTAPWGVTDQPDFLNAVMEVRSDLEPESLLNRLLEVESRLGRVRRERWGPRSLDLDLLAYGQRVVKTSPLEVPHPRLPERAFVLVPLCDLAPDWRHPVLTLTASQMLMDIPQEGILRTEIVL